jgi:hypothetical protein
VEISIASMGDNQTKNIYQVREKVLTDSILSCWSYSKNGTLLHAEFKLLNDIYILYLKLWKRWPYLVLAMKDKIEIKIQ